MNRTAKFPKIILILLLIFNSTHAINEQLRNELTIGIGLSMGCLLPGFFCSWLLYNYHKKTSGESKEIDTMIQCLKDMNVNVSEGYNYGSNFTKHYIKIEIPNNFSKTQREEVHECWKNLSSVYEERKRDINKESWAFTGAVFLIPIGIGGIYECIKYAISKTA